MNLFEAKAIYDSKTGKFLEEFYINGNPVDCDEYYFYLEREKDVEDKKLEDKKLEYKEKELVKEKIEENPYEYSNNDEVCECDECKYKDKKKYKSCDDNCKYMNCDECCNDFCDCENESCDDCEGCKIEEFDYGELLEIFAERIQETCGNKNSIKSILDEFADIFIEDYNENEFENVGEDCDECCECKCTCECENEEFSDEQLEEIKIIEEFTDNIMNIKCGAELRNELYRLYSMGKSIGWNDHCCFIQKLMDEALEE